jgi:hypothetical protein
LRVSMRTLIAVSATALSVCLSGVIAGAAQATASVPRTAAQPGATSYNVTGKLAGVATASNSSAWAVGSAGPAASAKVLMLHWNGKAWSRVTSPAVLTGAGKLNAITVVNAKDAWAVGYTGTLGAKYMTLLLHWNGKAWSPVARPAPVAGYLNAVTATASGGWAVGALANGHNFPFSLALRLSGVTWSRVQIPFNLDVSGVAVTGKNVAWAIGSTEQQSEFAQWNGHAWTWEFSILPMKDMYALGGIAAGPGGAAFTAGEERASGATGTVPVILKLAGSTWKKVTVKAPANAFPDAVSFAPGGAAWAAGTAGLSTLILRWNGSAWTRVTSPSPAGPDTLAGLGFSAANYGWAVGGSGADTLILHWNGKAWQ